MKIICAHYYLPRLLKRLIDYPGPLWKIYSVAGTLLIPFWTIIVGFSLFLFTLLPVRKNIHNFFIHNWYWFILKLFRVELHVLGLNNFDSRQYSLIVSNHQSLLDIPAAELALSTTLRMVSKKSLFYVPIMGWLMARTDFIFVNRQSARDRKKVAALIAERIRSGLHVWIAPEGTRSRTAQLLPFKSGAFAVAIEENIPIQPVVVENSYHICPKKSLFIKPGTILRFHILPRVETVSMGVDARKRVAESVRQSMAQVLQGSRIQEMSEISP